MSLLKFSFPVGLCPVTLDTPTNRADMPGANFSNWTPLHTVAETVLAWAEGKNRPVSGQLVRVVTKEGVTTTEVAH